MLCGGAGFSAFPAFSLPDAAPRSNHTRWRNRLAALGLCLATAIGACPGVSALGGLGGDRTEADVLGRRLDEEIVDSHVISVGAAWGKEIKFTYKETVRQVGWDPDTLAYTGSEASGGSWIADTDNSIWVSNRSDVGVEIQFRWEADAGYKHIGVGTSENGFALRAAEYGVEPDTKTVTADVTKGRLEAGQEDYRLMGVLVLGVYEIGKAPSLESHEVSVAKMQAALKSVRGSINFVNEAYGGEGGTDISALGDGSVIAVKSGNDAVVYGENVAMPENCESAFESFSMSSIDMESVDMSHVKSGLYMFVYCGNLTEIKASGWDLSSLEDAGGMFAGCPNLVTVESDGWTLGKLWRAKNMFMQDSKLENLDVSGWDMSTVTTMYCMFYQCYKLRYLDMAGWDTSACTDMSMMFVGCGELDGVAAIEGFDVSKVTSMNSFIYCCDKCPSTLDLSGWDVSNMSNMARALVTSSLRTIYIKDESMREKFTEAVDGSSSVSIVVKAG